MRSRQACIVLGLVCLFLLSKVIVITVNAPTLLQRPSKDSFSIKTKQESVLLNHDGKQLDTVSVDDADKDLHFKIVNDETRKHWPLITKEMYQHMVKIFQKGPPNYSWCHPVDSVWKGDSTKGLIFVKLPKAASSTLSGVVLRIAHHHGQRLYGSSGTGVLDLSSPSSPCFSRQGHTDASRFSSRNKSASFLLGNIRDISSREVSNIYYRQVFARTSVSSAERKVNSSLRSGPHLEWFVKRRRNIDAGFRLGYLNTRKDGIKSGIRMSSESRGLAFIQARVQQVMDDYDFIVVVERMDESLVVLQFLLDLDVNDILYLPSKIGGSYAGVGERCKLVIKPQIGPKISEYLSSKEWYAKYFGDYLLYKTINASLDATINSIGKERFDLALKHYKVLLREAKNKCGDTAFFPCSKNGTAQFDLSKRDCYQLDWGCGYPCLDRLRNMD